MVEATEIWESLHDAHPARMYWGGRGGAGDMLSDTLMRPVLVEIGHVLAEHALQVGLAQQHKVIQALPPHAAEEPLAGGVLPGGAVRGSQIRDAARLPDAGGGRPVLAVAIADEVARPLVERRGLAQLLGDSGVRRVTRGTDMHHATGPGRDHDEGVQGPEEQVGDGRKSQAQVCAPWLWGNVAQDWSARHVGRVPRMCR